jgi:mannosyltransferase OCH1-like enzyme
MIPKIVHQIWIGPNKRPDIWMNSVKDFCSKYEYQYMLWDNEAVQRITLKNKAIFDKIDQYCGKADVLRYEILFSYGGIYIDADSVILKGDKLNTIIEKFEGDCGFGYEINDERLCNGVIIANKHSKFLEICIENMKSRNKLIDENNHPWITIGPLFITEMYDKYKNEVQIKTYEREIFYPGGWHGITDVNQHLKIAIPDESVMFQYGYSTNFLSYALESTKKHRFIFNRFNYVNK